MSLIFYSQFRGLGISAPGIALFGITPIIAFFLLGLRFGIFYGMISALAVIVLYLGFKQGFATPTGVTRLLWSV